MQETDHGVEFRLLGPVGIWKGDHRLGPVTAQQRTVLAMLSLDPERVVSVDRLVTALWRGEPPALARNAVQGCVSRIRRVLATAGPAEARLTTSRHGYCLMTERRTVDLHRFRELVREAEKSEPAKAYELLRTGLRLWRGTALSDVAGSWLPDIVAPGLEEERLATVEQRVALDLLLGRHREIVDELSALVAEFPLRERLASLLLTALYRSERRVDALAAFQRVRRQFADELGIEPGDELQRAHQAILNGQEPLRELSTSLVTPAAISQPYVGRRAELAAVTALSGGVVLVSGEPGAGKTAFIEQVRAALTVQGWAVGWGRCPEHEGAPAGWAWAELLRELAGRFPPGDPEALAPLLSDVPVSGDVPGARFRLHRAVSAFAASIGRPLLLVLDDLHRADAETLAILTHVIGESAGLPILVVGSYRHTEPNEHLADVLAAIAAREPLRVRLDGLSEPEVGELVTATCGSPAAPETVAEIAERTGGNPFFVRETARLLDAEGATAIPAGVRDVLRRRVARLPEQAQTILRHGAVIGRESDVDVLTAVSGADEEAVLAAIEAGLVTGLLTEPEPGRLRFAHVLIRDTLYDDLSRVRRARLHLRVARAIEEHDPDDVAALAHHYTASAADPAGAVRFSRLAAEQAERRFAHHEAAALWQQALDAFDGDPRERLELTLSLVAALTSTGQLVKARTHRERAIREAMPLGDPDLLARVIVSFDVPTFWSNREYGTLDTDLIDAVEEALSRLPPGDGGTRCRLLTTLAFELEGEPTERGYLASQEAVAMARRLGDRHLLVLALNGRFHQSFRYGGQEERLEIGAELVSLADGDVTVEVLGRLMLMQAAINQAEFGVADREAARVHHLAELYDIPLAHAAVGFYHGLRAALAEDYEQAESRWRAAAELSGRLGMWQHEAGLLLLARYGMYLIRGDLTPMLPDLRYFATEGPWQEQCVELYALALCHAGRVEEARAVLADRLPRIRPDYFWHLLTAVRGLLGVAIGDRGRVEEAYERLLPVSVEPVGSTGYLAVWPTAQVLGDLAACLGRPVQPHYREALAVAERAGVRPWIDAARAALA
ncbi:AfsR/SARP family transcriptional regulator [Nonomuraea guangzhouensis]|uniref:BTAD domain-containing putative transcriptional regulator n=1 Tax=Nonomuraea guangzhouensis TaxID=1291555 RepID=A0ABW4GH24_9ACTN|nr:AfsR/SARP family transcriptional regulator [Nonomuraea guangzhouensis]